MAPGRDLVATDRGHRRRPPRTTCGPASTSPPRSAPPASAGRSTPPTGRVWRMDRRRAGRGVRRAGARTSRRSSSTPPAAGVRDRHRAAQPLRDLAGQHRRAGADRARAAARAGPRPGARHLPPQHRGALQRRRHPARRASTSSTCRSAATTAAPRATTRPTGRRCSPPSTRSATTARWSSRASPRTTPSIAIAASIWRPLAASPDDLARDGLALPAGAAGCGDSRRSRPARRRRHRLLLHGQGPLQRLAQRRRLPPRVPAGAPAGAGRPGPVGASRRPRTATAGPSRPPTGAPSSSATTSTSSTSAPPATCTTRSRSPRWRPASTCWSRSRWPTRSPRPRRWSRRRTRPRSAACCPWSGSTTAGSRRWRWPAS